MSTDRPDDRADEQIEAVQVAARAYSDVWAESMRTAWAFDDLDARDQDECVERVTPIITALSAAGLLSTPADQDERGDPMADEPTRQLAWEIFDQLKAEHGDSLRVAQTSEAMARAGRAEAKVRAVQELADRWERWGHDGVPIRPSTAAGYLRAAVSDAGGEQQQCVLCAQPADDSLARCDLHGTCHKACHDADRKRRNARAERADTAGGEQRGQ